MFDVIREKKANSNNGDGGCSGWQRPAEWLVLPKLNTTDEKIHILTYIQDHDSNFVAFLCQGSYTVDWGDGTVQNYNSNVKAYHTYDFSNIQLNTDTLEKLGYKQCIITIIPQYGEQLTLVNFDQFHPIVGSSVSYDKNQPFLDIEMSLPNCDNINLGASQQQYVTFYNIQRIRISNIIGTNLSFLCAGFRSLGYFELSEGLSGTNGSMQSMFRFCFSLNTIILPNTSNVTDMSNMFYSCASLTTIPLLDTSNVINMSGMFYNCFSLIGIPLLDTSNVTDMSNMFYSCASLTTIPLLDTSSIINNTNIFNFCYNISRCQIGPKFTFSIANNRLSANNLNELYEALPQVTGQTVTVTGNYGTSGDDPTIATNKGWTVTG